jgi:transglutaminase-like putative cysteine protease
VKFRIWTKQRADGDSVRPPVFSADPRRAAFRYVLAALVEVSVAAVCIENGLHPAALLLSPAILAAILRRDYTRPFLFSERLAARLFIAYVAALCVAAFVARRVSFPVFLVYFTFGATLVRVLSPLSDRNIAQLIFLTVGLILVNCILTNHVLFAAILPAYLACLMAALALFQVAKAPAAAGLESDAGPAPLSAQRKRLIKSLLFILAGTAVLFIFLPRPFGVVPSIGAAMLRPGGFADLNRGLSYRNNASMGSLNRVAFLVRFEKGAPPANPYWRGSVMDETDGEKWFSSETARPRLNFVRSERRETLVYSISPYRLQSKMVFHCGLPVTALGRYSRPLLINSAAEVIVDTPFLFSDSYQLTSLMRPLPVDAKSRTDFLGVAGIPDNIFDLAHEWTKDARTPGQRAQAILTRLGSDYTYRLSPPPPPENVNALEYFLFKSRSGNCEYFAGAMGVMLRAVGVPCRVVGGFMGMEKTSEPNEFIVRFFNAHAWVEAILDGKTWSTLDPTPARGARAARGWLDMLADAYDAVAYNWARWVVDFDRTDQQALAGFVSRLVRGRVALPFRIDERSLLLRPVIAVAAVILLAALLVILRRRQDPGDLEGLYWATMTALVRRGALGSVHTWHEDNTRAILDKAPSLREALTAFMDAYLKSRFGMAKAGAYRELTEARRRLLHDASQARQGRGLATRTDAPPCRAA